MSSWPIGLQTGLSEIMRSRRGLAIERETSKFVGKAKKLLVDMPQPPALEIIRKSTPNNYKGIVGGKRWIKVFNLDYSTLQLKCLPLKSMYSKKTSNFAPTSLNVWAALLILSK